jgi:iron complex outermembrane receptor protein
MTAGFSGYATAFNSALASGVAVPDAHRQARAASDAGRPVPGTPEFDELINELRDINDWKLRRCT